jgi:hypothetical protein
MVLSTLSALKNLLYEHLKLSYKLENEIVAFSSFADSERTKSLNKVAISLVNVERETNSGIKFNYKNISSNQYKKTLPAWQLNLYVLIACVFSDKQYEESLRLLSGIIFLLQNNNTFFVSEINSNLAIEPVNLSFNELSNLWSICGNAYYPSVLCKIRVLNFESDEIKKVESSVENQDLGIEKVAKNG